ncbi:MAG: hypothetical protein M3Q07_19900 [Pseudobdellovibrionaceae bacterium]|nr:hypothetical protein [Pseudobdellovibrionaceae bacterium]
MAEETKTSSFKEQLRNKNPQAAAGQAAAAAAVEEHVDTLIPDRNREESMEAAAPAPKQSEGRKGAKTKKELPKYEPADEAGKVSIPVYLRPALAKKLEEHRWQGRWKSRTALIEHIIEEYYKNFE